MKKFAQGEIFIAGEWDRPHARSQSKPVDLDIPGVVQGDIFLEPSGNHRARLEAVHFIEDVREVERVVPDIRTDVEHDATRFDPPSQEIEEALLVDAVDIDPLIDVLRRI